jgi:hypothetical protein
VADGIQSRIGGDLWEVKPPRGASNIGKYHEEDTFWGDHTFVVKDGWAYDQWTGPEGEPLQTFKEQFEYWDVLNFGPK